METNGAASVLKGLLKVCDERQASDLHLAPDHPPYLRIQGVLAPLDGACSITPETLGQLVSQLSQGCNVRALESTGSLDGALSSESGSRYRYNVYRRGGQYSVALRRLDDNIRSLAELGLPDHLYRLSELSNGLVVVAGPTGSGKSTTLATLINRINHSRQCHIVTIEDPIEYIHPSHRALVNQRQIGTDASTFNDALVASLRQDPDVILVGEVRNLETIRTAITAAETGHLVFTTVHAGDCVGAIERLVSVFPSDEQPGIRRQLSMVLRAIISQHLLVADGTRHQARSEMLAKEPGWSERDGDEPVRDAQHVDQEPGHEKPENEQDGGAPEGGGARKPRLVLASEVLSVNSAVANLVASGKDNQVYSVMETGSHEGMYTLEENLARLWQRGEISERAATALARNPKVMLDRARKMGQARPNYPPQIKSSGR